MSIEQIFSMTPQQVSENYAEVKQVIRENRRFETGFPSVFHEGEEIQDKITHIEKASFGAGYEVHKDGNIVVTGFSRNHTGCF